MFKRGDYVVCVDNSDYVDDLILGGIYRVENSGYEPVNRRYYLKLENNLFFIQKDLYLYKLTG